MRKIIISIALVALMLTGCSKNEGKTTAVESIATDTVATIGDASADATTEATLEVVSNEKPEAVPATTEIGGGKKKAEETTEEQKPSTSSNGGSGHSTTSGNSSNNSTNNGSSNSSNNSSGSSNSGNSGNGGSQSSNSNSSGNSSSGGNNSGNSGSNNSGASTPSTTEAPKPSTTEASTTQHQHVYDQVVVDTPEQRIDYPEQGYYAPAKQCNTCYQVFISSADFVAHATYGGGSCPADGYGSTQVWVKTKDAYTEVIPAKTHRECKCGARE